MLALHVRRPTSWCHASLFVLLFTLFDALYAYIFLNYSLACGMWVSKWQNVHVWVDCPFKREEKAGCLCVQWGKGKRLQADGLCSEISAELWEGSGMGQGQGSKQTHLFRCTHTAEGLWPEWQRLITAAEARENENNGDRKTCAFIYNSISFIYNSISL